MSYLVFCTFDLKGGSALDYQNAYSDLAKLGLGKVVKSDKGTDFVIPTTAAMGEFNGGSGTAVRDYIAPKIEAAFRARRFTSEIFIVVGTDWSWDARRT